MFLPGSPVHQDPGDLLRTAGVGDQESKLSVRRTQFLGFVSGAQRRPLGISKNLESDGEVLKEEEQKRNHDGLDLFIRIYL